MTPDEAIQEYQCPGCVRGPFPSCCVRNIDPDYGCACNAHQPATTQSHIGLIFLGLPKGFCRLGDSKRTKISIFESEADGWEYNKFQIPIWKHIDKLGNTLVRGICPRINDPWIHIYLNSHGEIINCLEITDQDIKEMD